MMKKQLFTWLLAITTITVYAQKQKSSESLQPYQPSQDFLKHNPDFLRDSIYNLEWKVWKIGGTSMRLDGFNSNNWPIKSVIVKASLNNDLVYNIICGNANDYPFSESKFKSNLRINSEFYNKRSQKENLAYKTPLLGVLGDDNFKTLNFKLHDIRAFIPAMMSDNSVYLKISMYDITKQINPEKNQMPNIFGIKMVILNNFFDTLKTYRHAVFYGKTPYSEDKIKNIATKQVLPNLFAQFANDTEVQNAIINGLDIRKYNSNYLTSKEALYNLKQIQQKKEVIIDILKTDYDMQGEAEEMEKSLKTQMNVDAIVGLFQAGKATGTSNADIIANGVGQVANSLFAARDQKYTEEKAKRAHQIIQLYRDLEKEEAELFKKLENTALIKKSEFAGKTFTKNELIDKIAMNIKEGEVKLKNQISANSSYTKTKLENQMAAIQSAITAQANAQNGNGINGAQGAIEGDDCNKAATAELATTREAKAYKDNPASAANTADYKAKLIELTLQHCRNKLPASEIKALEKAAATERAAAIQIRKANTTNFRVN